MRIDNNTRAFLSLVQAGLWEQEVRLEPFGKVDFEEIMRLAEEQSVVGLVTAGLEHVADVNVPSEDKLQFVGQTLQIEQRNEAMNAFIGNLVNKMRIHGIYTLLLKGQGIAQCYERPLWRTCGDVDFFLSKDNYQKAIDYLSPIAIWTEEENYYIQHIAMTIDEWEVELHGTLRGGLWKRLDKTLDDVQKAIFFDGKIRSWKNKNVQVFLPKEDEDVIYVFSHILQHFFKEGIGLRQICDWCRLLWVYKEKINIDLLQHRLKAMGTETEWKTLAALAVDNLGMPMEAIPLYSPSEKWKCKSKQLMHEIIDLGNFGHNRDISFQNATISITRKIKTFIHISGDTIKHFCIFPLDSIKVWWRRMGIGVQVMFNNI